jgi:uncharacterized membrane protein
MAHDMVPEDTPNPTPASPAEQIADLASRVARLEKALLQLQIHPPQPTLDSSPSRIVPPPPRQTPPPPPLASTSASAPPPPPPPLASTSTSAPPPPTPQQSSLEDRLGAQLFNRIGIVAVLFGAALFLKLAVDSHWIGPLGRVLVGLLSGAGLILWSERFRRRHFAAFSYSLKAIGTGVLYLSLWAAFQLYHLLPAPVALLLMLAVTAWNAFMAWAQEAELLAVYALAGAFATPLLLATGGNHQAFLFSYLLAADLATLVLVRAQQRRPNTQQPQSDAQQAQSDAKLPQSDWSRLFFLALPSTAAYFLDWFTRFYTPDKLLSTGLFLALFFVAFLTVPLLPKDPPAETTEQGSTLALIPDLALPLANALLSALALYSLLEDAHQHDALPWFALLLGAVYLALLRLPQRIAARAAHLSLAVVFLSVAIPLKATGAAIPLAWLAEAVALLWIALRLQPSTPSPAQRPAPPTVQIAGQPTAQMTGQTIHQRPAESPAPPNPLPRVLRLLATAALLLGVLGLFLHPIWIYPAPATAFLNHRFAAALAGILALAAAATLARRAALGTHPDTLRWRELSAATTIALNLIALQAGVLEIQTLWLPAPGELPAPDAPLATALSISAFFALYGAALLALGFLRRSAFLRWNGLVLLLLAIAKTFLFDLRSLSQGYRVASLLGLGALLLAISFAYQKDWLSLRR